MFVRLLLRPMLVVLLAAGAAAQQPATTEPSSTGAQSTASGASSSQSENAPESAQAGNSASGGDQAGKPYRVGAGVTPPKALYDPDPEYSDKARKAHYQGTVILWLIVGADGLPRNIRVQRSLGMGLDEEAIKAVKLWRFQPSMKDGHPVPVMVNVEVNFRLYQLLPHPDSASDPPRFPGVKTSKYPLVLHLTEGVARAANGENVQGYHADIVDGGQQLEAQIYCENNTPQCLGLSPGTYPARWVTQGSTLEILGLNGGNSDWTKTVYSVGAKN